MAQKVIVMKTVAMRIPVSSLVVIAAHHRNIFPVGVCVVCTKAGWVDGDAPLGYPAKRKVPREDENALQHASDCAVNRLFGNDGHLKKMYRVEA